MRSWLAVLRAPFGTTGSLHRKLTVNIMLALLAAVMLAAAVMIYEFFEHLEESLDDALRREANEVLIQAEPDQPYLGFSPDALRFRGASGAYRYTVFDDQTRTVVGSEDSPSIRSALASLPLGSAQHVPLPGERRGMGLCGEISGQRICVLASAYAPLTDTTILGDMWHELEEQVQWVLLGSLLVLASALLTARLTLRPLSQIQNEAREVGPDTPDRRLSTEGLPSEITPLVEAVNRAFSRLEKGYRAQRAFSANVAHEVRTPLAVLRSRVELAEDPKLRAQLKRDLRRLEEIFEQLIDLARADALAPAAFEQTDLGKLALQVCCNRGPEAIKMGKSLAVTGAKTLPVKGHPGLLEIAIDNLVRNALAYAPTGSEVELHLDDAAATLDVKDRGPGIPSGEHAAMFDRFKRGKGSAKSEGSGLGLAIVKSVAEAHGAQIRVANRPGGGSIFSLHVPALTPR
ncbi:sensor histidine kinase [Phycobacter sp. K97]|uniref:sensor histidine kinase n=1 Tax=Phycobacter sedimenti TaxID=3133977 RepID=UPI00311E1B1A